MLSVARVAYKPLKALAVNVAVYSRSRHQRRKPDSMTTVDPRVEPLYSPVILVDASRQSKPKPGVCTEVLARDYATLPLAS